MSKIIVFNKCEGFCKHRTTKSTRGTYNNPEGVPPNRLEGVSDFVRGTDSSSLYCRPGRWFLYYHPNDTDWFKKTFNERCPFENKSYFLQRNKK